jgi:hypothetical protein
VNPFLVPKTGPKSARPLRPTEEESHLQYYVPVDDTESSFVQFCEMFKRADYPESRGRLTIAYGDTGCGKSSLIHRCAHHVRTGLPDGRAVVVDLTVGAFSQDTVERRMFDVGVAIVDHLVATRMLGDERIDPPDAPDQVSSFYRRLSAVLARVPAVLVVLLPATHDLVGELQLYAQHAALPRLMFFAETSAVDRVGEALDPLPAAVRDEVVLLRVGPLNAEDGWALVAARTRNGVGGRRRVDRATMRTAGAQIPPAPIAQMVSMLVDLWDDTNEGANEEIRLQDIYLYLLKQVKNSRR